MKEKALAFITQDADTFQLVCKGLQHAHTYTLWLTLIGGATQISANSAFSDLPEHLLVDIYRELLVQIGGFSSSTTGALITQENKYGPLADELLDSTLDFNPPSTILIFATPQLGQARRHTTPPCVQHSGHGRRSPVAFAERRQVRISCPFIVIFLFDLLTLYCCQPEPKGAKRLPAAHRNARRGHQHCPRAAGPAGLVGQHRRPGHRRDGLAHSLPRGAREHRLPPHRYRFPHARGFGVKLDHVNSFRLRSTNRTKR